MKTLISALLLAGLVHSQPTKSTLACLDRPKMPTYPRLARAAQIQGRADASFTVGQDGKPTGIVVTATHEGLRLWIEPYVAKSQFRLDCAGTRLNLRVRFTLHEPRQKYGLDEIVLVPPDTIEVSTTRPEATIQGTPVNGGDVVVNYKEDIPLKAFLQGYARESQVEDDNTTWYFRAFFDLNEDGQNEAIVYLVGRWWCGTGGCQTLILTPDAGSYRIITTITITRPPIQVLTGTSNDWRSISVWVQGGGVQPGYEAELRFDGRTYPTNPSVPPARRLAGNAAGYILISPSQDRRQLHP
jgi:hypothetical protein